jgi:hypothetical protein
LKPVTLCSTMSLAAASASNVACMTIGRPAARLAIA